MTDETTTTITLQTGAPETRAYVGNSKGDVYADACHDQAGCVVLIGAEADAALAAGKQQPTPSTETLTSKSLSIPEDKNVTVTHDKAVRKSAKKAK